MREILVTVSAAVFGAVGPGVLTWVLGPLLRTRFRAGGFPAELGSLLILIPAHDEESTVSETIRSALASAQAGGMRARVIVGADACRDGTARVARAAGASVEEVGFRSKWRTLAALAQRAEHGEWVALVDAGALWPPGLVAEIRTHFSDPQVLGVAPSYFPAGASRLERLLWRLEAFWKLGENRAGGPVSVHGATVFYRAEALRSALACLAHFREGAWLNDDVAIPFAARLQYPGASLVYWCPRETARRVSDVGLREGAAEGARRARMVAGNLEWALTLFPAALARSPGLAFVALRRLLRIFWAYWVVLFAYGIFLWACGSRESAIFAVAGASAVAAAALLAARKRGMIDAAMASFAAPLLVYPVLRGRSRAWG